MSSLKRCPARPSLSPFSPLTLALACQELASCTRIALFCSALPSQCPCSPPPSEPLAMPSSLLSLPDELLTLVVDQALGEYAPRLYKERQATAWALSLVNRRIGAISQPRLVEVVHVECEGEQGPSPSIGRLPVNGCTTSTSATRRPFTESRSSAPRRRSHSPTLMLCATCASCACQVYS